jgi:hypothetical protein
MTKVNTRKGESEERRERKQLSKNIKPKHSSK